MKRYIVFLKQVPLSTKVEMDPVTRYGAQNETYIED